jgi:hypothetical protein
MPALIRLSALFIVAASFIPGKARAQDVFESPRNANVPVTGARTVRVDAAAGSLRIEGHAGRTDVRVRGTARSVRRDRLDDIKLIAERRGNEIYIKAEMPETNSRDWWNYRNGPIQALDLVIEVPTTMSLDVDDGSGEAIFLNTGALRLEDGSGSVEVRGARGDVEINDGSGNVDLDGIEGNVEISDGSGEIRVRNVTGDVVIPDDGSGGIDIAGVGGTVRVNDDSSGSIEVDRVAGDFVVDSDGSGGISYTDVKGRVRIPERKRRG